VTLAIAVAGALLACERERELAAAAAGRKP
jgi:hypothetical protein